MFLAERPRNEPSEDGPPAQMPNTNMSRLEDLVDAIATKYVDQQEREEELLESPVRNLIERNNQPDDWPLWRVKCTVRASVRPFQLYLSQFSLVKNTMFYIK